MDFSDPTIPLEDWVHARARLRQMFPDLTESDLELIAGREECLLETVAKRTGRTREAVIDAFGAVGMFRPPNDPRILSV